jgi:NAD-dependent deacetylase
MGNTLHDAARLVVTARFLGVLTGAGISVESGIPPFRGENGLWSKYDAGLFDISYFKSSPLESWRLLKELFYESFRNAKPNEAHYVLARLEEKKLLKSLITQNIDSLHFNAGSRNVVEYHGNTRELVCTKCRKRTEATPEKIEELPPLCECGGVLKPNIVFFGEEIPITALLKVQKTAERTDVLLVVGTTGEVFPASFIPFEVKKRNAKIIEVNIQPSRYTGEISDIFLQGKASEVLHDLEKEVDTLL